MYPQMTTESLRRVNLKPTSLDDPQAIKKELAVRKLIR
jgi:hypothetical protein